MKLFGFTIIRTENLDTRVSALESERDDYKAWLVKSGRQRQAAEAEVVSLREALWVAMDGDYRRAEPDGVELPDRLVIAYQEQRTWRRQEMMSLEATVTFIQPNDSDEGDFILHRMENALFLNFRGLAWKVEALRPQRETRSDFRLYEITMVATAHPESTTPNFKRGYTGN